MSREIKFQILYNNKVEGYERLTEKGWEWMWISLNPDNGERWNKGTIQDSHKLIRRQYTGLKDRNGKEIYEGDILDCGEYHGIKEVVFMNGSYKIRGKMGQMVGFGSWANKTKVIGNVFENPELL